MSVKSALRYFKRFPVVLLLIALIDIAGAVLVLAYNAANLREMASCSEQEYADMSAKFTFVGFPMSAYFFAGFFANACVLVAGIGILIKRCWGWWLQCGVGLYLVLVTSYVLLRMGLLRSGQWSIERVGIGSLLLVYMFRRRILDFLSLPTLHRGRAFGILLAANTVLLALFFALG